MLYPASNLKGFTIGATDCDLGSVKDVYFDDDNWRVRYLVADVGERILPGRKVLITPLAIRVTEQELRRIDVGLTCQEVKDSPDIDTDKPISRQYETAYFNYYGLPYYWTRGYGVGTQAARELVDRSVQVNAPSGDPHLHSGNEVTGYHIEALDGGIGHLDDLLIDIETWRIAYAAVDTRNYWPGRHVLIAPEWIAHVSWAERKIHVGVSREAVRQSPEYGTRAVVSPEYERQLRKHYAGQLNGGSRGRRCQDVMKTDLKCISPDRTLEDAAAMMRDEGVGFLPVCDPQRHVLGAITDRDITVRAVASHESTSQPVVGFMTNEVIACRPDDDLDTVHELMSREKVSRILCVDEAGVLEGIISLSDIAQLYGDSGASATLRNVSARETRA